MNKRKKSFGMTLRAMRLGFHELDGLGYVRCVAGGPPWEVDVVPFGDVRAWSRGDHLVWWEGDCEIIVAKIREAVRHTAGDQEVQKPFTLFLDDDGNLIRSEERKLEPLSEKRARREKS